QTRSQARAQAVLTTTPRAPLDGTPEVPHLRTKFDRGPILEGAAPSRKEGRGPRRSSSFSGVVRRFPGTSRTIFRGPGEDGTGGPALAQSEPSQLAIMQQMTQIMANLQEASSSKAARPPAFKTPSMKAPECFDGTQPFKNWRLGERALIHHFRKRLPSRILDQLASHHSSIDSLQDLMDFTLELDTRYHERQKEKGHDQEKKPESSKSNSSHHQNSSSSSQKKKKNSHSQKRDKPHSSLLNKDFKLLGSEKERIIKEGLCTYCGGKHSLESCFKRP
ncbi:hypothetical protein O181_098195, partial [Austropuccinia psidii MF-1]|nr:hypothetical protein [Austropuccinia psidii MF-1]